MIKAVHKLIDALRGNPVLLVVLGCNVLIIAALLLLLREVAVATKADRDTRNALLTQCMNR